MKRSESIMLFLCFMLCFIPLSEASGAQITNPSNPALSGASVINFETATPGTYNSPITINDVEFSADSTMHVENDYSGNYNTTGQYLASRGESDSFTFRFSTPVSAFGFNWGASDVIWTLTAYNSQNNQLDSMQVPPVFGSNNGEFFGLSANNISYATLTAAAGSGDYVMIDNFSFKAGEGVGAIPTLNEWGQILFAMIVTVSAFWFIRRAGKTV